MPVIRMLIVDDFEKFREFVRSMLSKYRDLEVVVRPRMA
jgi:hypothetical protein